MAARKNSGVFKNLTINHVLNTDVIGIFSSFYLMQLVFVDGYLLKIMDVFFASLFHNSIDCQGLPPTAQATCGLKK